MSFCVEEKVHKKTMLLHDNIVKYWKRKYFTEFAK